MKTMVRPVVLCGGSGTRLWPLSRPDLPKQFIEFPHGAETSTLFKYALKRVDAETPCCRRRRRRRPQPHGCGRKGPSVHHSRSVEGDGHNARRIP